MKKRKKWEVFLPGCPDGSCREWGGEPPSHPPSSPRTALSALPCLAATSGSDSQWTTSHCLLTTWMLTNSHWFLPNHKSHVTWWCQVQVHQRSVYFKFFWKFSWLLVAWFLLDGRTSSSQVGRPRRTEPYWRQVVDTPPSPYGRFPWLATNICRGNNGHSLGLPWLTTQLKWAWFYMAGGCRTLRFPSK